MSNCFEAQGRQRLAACLTALFAVLAGVEGCDSGGAKPPDSSTQASVSGSVTNDGKPITQDSSIVFYCSEKSATAAGKIDALGKFSLKEADPKIGIPAGRYQVMVRPPDEPAIKIAPDSEEYKRRMMAGSTASGTTPKPPERATDIPSKFQSFDSSGIALEVKVGPNTVDLDLAKLGK